MHRASLRLSLVALVASAACTGSEMQDPLDTSGTEDNRYYPGEFFSLGYEDIEDLDGIETIELGGGAEGLRLALDVVTSPGPEREVVVTVEGLVENYDPDGCTNDPGEYSKPLCPPTPARSYEALPSVEVYLSPYDDSDEEQLLKPFDERCGEELCEDGDYFPDAALGGAYEGGYQVTMGTVDLARTVFEIDRDDYLGIRIRIGACLTDECAER